MEESQVVARSPLEEKAIEALLKGIDSPAFQPPMLPQVAQKAMLAAKNPDVGLASLGQIIAGDQALAARFLAVANSPMYRGRLPTTSVPGALSRMGLVVARDLLFFAAVEPVLFKSKAYAAEMEALRQHSLATSAACAHLAQFKRFSVEDAALAGLVHDIGAAALLQFMAERPAQFAGVCAQRGSLAAVLAATHTVAGAKAGTRWGLPDPVKEVIADHHAPAPGSPLLVRLVAAADELAALCNLGSSLEPTPNTALVQVLEDPSLIDSVVDGFAMRLGEVEGL